MVSWDSKERLASHQNSRYVTGLYLDNYKALWLILLLFSQ